VKAARKLQDAASGLTKGEIPELEQCLLRLEDARTVLKQVLDKDPRHSEAVHVLKENERLHKSVVGRRDDLVQRQAVLASAVREGREFLDRARTGTSGDLGDLRQALADCQAAESSSRRALTLQNNHPEALENLEDAQTLQQHLASTIEIEVEKQQAEAKAQRREEEMQSSLDAKERKVEPKPPSEKPDHNREEARQRAGKIYRKAQSLQKEMKFEADRIHDLLEQSAGILDQAGVKADKKDKAGKLRTQIEHMQAKVAPKVEFARKARRIDDGLDQAEKLIEEGRLQEARVPLLDLHELCLATPELKEQLQDVNDLLAQTARPAGLRKRLWIGIAATLLVVVLAVVTVVMMKDSGEGEDSATGSLDRPEVVKVEPGEQLRASVDGHIAVVEAIYQGQEPFRPTNDQIVQIWNNLDALDRFRDQVGTATDSEWSAAVLEKLGQYNDALQPAPDRPSSSFQIRGKIYLPGSQETAADAAVILFELNRYFWIIAHADDNGNYVAGLTPGLYAPVAVRYATPPRYKALETMPPYRLRGSEGSETFDARPTGNR